MVTSKSIAKAGLFRNSYLMRLKEPDLLSLLQDNQETGIPNSGTPSRLWFVPTAKLVLERPHPPPVLWTQNPCFHDVTGKVAL
jgi:hypothetical protein